MKDLEKAALERLDAQDPLALFRQQGVEIDRSVKSDGSSSENEEKWTLTGSTGLNLQIMALGPAALRGMKESCDAKGMVELGIGDKKQKVPLALLHSIFASNVQSGDQDFDDKVSLRSESNALAQEFLSSPSLRKIALRVVDSGGSIRILDDRVEIVVLGKTGEEAWLSDDERGLILSHVLSVGQ